MNNINEDVAKLLEGLYPGQVIWITTPYGRLPTLRPSPAIPVSKLVASTITADQIGYGSPIETCALECKSEEVANE